MDDLFEYYDKMGGFPFASFENFLQLIPGRGNRHHASAFFTKTEKSSGKWSNINLPRNILDFMQAKSDSDDPRNIETCGNLALVCDDLKFDVTNSNGRKAICVQVIGTPKIVPFIKVICDGVSGVPIEDDFVKTRSTNYIIRLENPLGRSILTLNVPPDGEIRKGNNETYRDVLEFLEKLTPAMLGLTRYSVEDKHIEHAKNIRLKMLVNAFNERRTKEKITEDMLELFAGPSKEVRERPITAIEVGNSWD